MSSESQNSSVPRPPRGIRNNNPFNIRIGEKWQGLVQSPTDTAFCQFVSMEYGVRAGFRLLHTYITKYHCNSIIRIIQRFAPVKENNTATYIHMVAAKTKIDCEATISADDKSALIKLANAIIWCETGYVLDQEIINNAYNLAFPCQKQRKIS